MIFIIWVLGFLLSAGIFFWRTTKEKGGFDNIDQFSTIIASVIWFISLPMLILEKIGIYKIGKRKEK